MRLLNKSSFFTDILSSFINNLLKTTLSVGKASLAITLFFTDNLTSPDLFKTSVIFLMMSSCCISDDLYFVIVAASASPAASLARLNPSGINVIDTLVSL